MLDKIQIGFSENEFTSRAAAQASYVVEGCNRISVMTDAGSLAYVSDPQGTALATADGRTWSPDGDATPEHWGVVAGIDQTALIKLMLDWTTPRGVKVKWGGKLWVWNDYSLTGEYLNPVWEAEGAVLWCAREAGSDVPFVRFDATTKASGVSPVTLNAGTTKITAPENVVSAVTVGKDVLSIQSDLVIETDSRGQARHGFSGLVTRKVSATEVEIDCHSPVTMLSGNEPEATVTAVNAGAMQVTVASWIGKSRSDMRYRLVFVTVNGQTMPPNTWALPDDFDPDTGTFTLVRDYPTGLRAGDRVYLRRQIDIYAVAPVTGSFDGIIFQRPVTVTAPIPTGNADGVAGHRGLWIRRGHRTTVTNCQTIGFSDVGIQFQHSHRVTVDGVVTLHSNRQWGGTNGTGYGVAVDGCMLSNFRNIEGFGCRRIFDIGGSQVSSYYCKVSGIDGIGGGTAYTGQATWPDVTTLVQSVAGSHGGAFFTKYSDVSGHDVWTIMNMRGAAEQVNGVTGSGVIEQLGYSFEGDPPSAKGLYYSDNRPDNLSDPAKYSRTKKNGSLRIGWNVWGSSVISDRPIVISDVNLRGLTLCLLALSNGGSYGRITLGGMIYLEVERQAANTDPDFWLVRSTGNVRGVLAGDVDLGRPTIINRTLNTKSRIWLLDESSFDIPDGVIIKHPDGSLRTYVSDDTVVRVPAYRNGLGTLSLRSRNASRQPKCQGVYLTPSGREQPAFGFAAAMDFLSAVPTGTTGTDGNVNVAYQPAGGGNFLYVENRLGSRDFWVINFSEAI